MEDLPVEIVGSILSRLGTARDVVIASATCRKWQEAWKNNLHTLTFNCYDWPLCHEFSTSRLEIIITRTIFQTKGLQCLSIIMDFYKFSAAPVIAWLMYTRETLRQLHYNGTTSPNINILEKCGRQKLEVLALAGNTITGVEPSYQKFPCLRSLSLSNISISALDLSLLLIACPKLEILNLVSLVMSDRPALMDLSGNSLKEVYVKALRSDKFILEADRLEKLQLISCTIKDCELIGKGMLRFLKIEDFSFIHLDIGDSAENLEIVDVSYFTIMWAKFHHKISRSSKLRKLRLGGFLFDDDDEFVDIENISSCFPLLSHLSLNYDIKEAAFQNSLQGSFVLENVVVLELGRTVISDLFSTWVSGLVERCPRLRNLVIHGVVSEKETYEECLVLANFTKAIVRLMRKFPHVEVQFEYK